MTPFALVEIEDRPAELRLFGRFYHDIYSQEFPDPNERESFENMREYLRRKRDGWYGTNNYHVLLATVAGRPVGCAIADYLAEPNTGVIEFLTVAPAWRHRGLGQALRIGIESRLAADAGRTCRGLDYVVGEMNDPLRRDPAVADNMDPVARALLWRRWGYRLIDFDYIQPALSSTQAPVYTLRLIVRVGDGLDQERIATPRLLAILGGYMRWAMRIEEPEQAPEFREMARRLGACPDVALCDLARYVEQGSPSPIG